MNANGIFLMNNRSIKGITDGLFYRKLNLKLKTEAISNNHDVTILSFPAR
jgi:hypothetical protein